jgi:hypothetical protein
VTWTHHRFLGLESDPARCARCPFDKGCSIHPQPADAEDAMVGTAREGEPFAAPRECPGHTYGVGERFAFVRAADGWVLCSRCAGAVSRIMEGPEEIAARLELEAIERERERDPAFVVTLPRLLRPATYAAIRARLELEHRGDAPHPPPPSRRSAIPARPFLNSEPAAAADRRARTSFVAGTFAGFLAGMASVGLVWLCAIGANQ